MPTQREAKIKEMSMLVFTEVKKNGDDRLDFTAEDGRMFTFVHDQDCCESVYIEDIAGNLDDLVGAPMLMAEDVSAFSAEPDIRPFGDDVYQWTFYKFATIKGYVTVRWYGSSNGYYATDVSLYVSEPDSPPQQAITA